MSHDGEDGVYFFSLDAEGILGVLGARLFHHLPYYYARIDLDTDGHRIHFESKRFHPGDRPARFRGSYKPTGESFTPNTDPLATFLVERYRYYTEAPSEELRYAAIDHEPWPLYEADVTIDENSLPGERIR